jgi:hypothetical protein
LTETSVLPRPMACYRAEWGNYGVPRDGCEPAVTRRPGVNLVRAEKEFEISKWGVGIDGAAWKSVSPISRASESKASTFSTAELTAPKRTNMLSVFFSFSFSFSFSHSGVGLS